MSTGMALYGTERVNAIDACKYGWRLFEIMGIDITTSGYMRYFEHHGVRDVELIEVGIQDLEGLLKSGQVRGFRLYNNPSTRDSWNASFGCNVDDFGGFFYIDAQIDLPLNECRDKFVAYIGEVSARAEFSYGFVFESEDVVDAYNYASGGSLVKLKKYENAAAFRRESPIGSVGCARYEGSMLRMIYPVNILNDRHLAIEVEGIKLKEWIIRESDRGVVDRLADDIWLWSVPDESIDQLNEICGKGGILVSWKESVGGKPRRNLP